MVADVGGFLGLLIGQSVYGIYDGMINWLRLKNWSNKAMKMKTFWRQALKSWTIYCFYTRAQVPKAWSTPRNRAGETVACLTSGHVWGTCQKLFWLHSSWYTHYHFLKIQFFLYKKLIKHVKWGKNIGLISLDISFYWFNYTQVSFKWNSGITEIFFGDLGFWAFVMKSSFLQCKIWILRKW